MIAAARIGIRLVLSTAIVAAFVLQTLTAIAFAQGQTPSEWDKLPRMPLERQFAGPLRDTVIQRLRDPVDGTICYLYLPITAPHSDVRPSGFVEYGPNIIGSINCLPSAGRPAEQATPRPAPPRPTEAAKPRPPAKSAAPQPTELAPPPGSAPRQ